MNKKLIFRILGAIASALIIVGVFIPFVSVSGYSQSLWQTYEAIGALYLPIMIIIFGLIGVLFFSLNIKTEFAYMSTGAIAFFVVMQTLDIIEQDMFSTLSIGYYCLAIGAILTGVMAFLTNLKPKKVSLEQSVSVDNNQSPMLEQIDKLYDNKNDNQNVVPTIQPIPVQPTVQPVSEVPQINTIQPLESNNLTQINSNVVIEPLNDLSSVQTQELNNEINIPSIQPQVNSLMDMPIKENPVIQQFTNQDQPVVNSIQNFGITGIQNEPIMSANQFESNQSMDVPVTSVSQPQSSQNMDIPVNPVIQQFTNLQKPLSQPEQNTENKGVDIFGQPINK